VNPVKTILDRINRINMMLPLYISKDRNPNDPVNLPEADKSCLILSSAGLCGSSDREGTGERYDHSAAFVCVGVARSLRKKPTGGAACWWTLSAIYVSVGSLFACSKQTRIAGLSAAARGTGRGSGKGEPVRFYSGP
jgi:hypothetical protein